MTMQLGKYVELEIGKELENYCREKTWRFANLVTNENLKKDRSYADRRQGTDYRINNIRIDVTLADKTEKVTEGYENVQLGKYGQVDCFIRRSNGYIGKNGKTDGIFKDPVLVVRALNVKDAKDAVAKLVAFFTGKNFLDVMKLFFKKIDEIGTYKIEQGCWTEAQCRAKKNAEKMERMGIHAKVDLTVPHFNKFSDLFDHYFK